MAYLIRFILCLVLALFCSCSTLTEIDLLYLEREEMQHGLTAAEEFEKNFENYREGASGGVHGKGAGGCGCY